MRIINFESGDYYERASAPKKNKKGKKSSKIVQEIRGTQWYVGSGSPDTIPLSEWEPNAEKNPPREGDIYMDTVTGEYGAYITTGKPWNEAREEWLMDQ